MEAVVVLLSVVCVSGALAACPDESALFITAPKTLEALNGSCLMIPCNFSTKAESLFTSTGTIYGVWIKSDPRFGQNSNNVIYNSSRTVNIYPVSITGDLRQRNCSTEFNDLTPTHTDSYYFRIDGSVKATAVCDPLQINVTDSLVPSITVPGDLREQQSVTITCSAFTPCPRLPPKLTWTLRRDPQTHREENSDGTFTTKIQETLTLSEQHDGLNISCSASYPVTGGSKAAEAVVTLSVSNVTSHNVIELLAAVGGTTGLIGLIGLIGVCWRLCCRRLCCRRLCCRRRSTRRQPPGEDPDIAEPSETVHYGEIHFSEPRPKPSGASEQDTVYAEVQTQPLYAEVRKNYSSAPV